MANIVDEELKKKEEQKQQDEQAVLTTKGEENANNSNGYTLDDAVSVADTGSLPTINTEPQDPYTKYMADFKSEYDKQVEANNKVAANRAAAANSEYNELNRNVNEINKANGRANTGYAGDTSIEAYNAYKNAINEAYAEAESSNNDLYSYYMQQMINLQQAKDNKEATDRQLKLQEQEYNDAQTETILATISDKLNEDGAFNANGTINSEKAEEVWKYLNDYYGSSENIPREIMATLNSSQGFTNWLDAYNGKQSGDSTAYDAYLEDNQTNAYAFATEEGKRGSSNTFGKVNIQGFGTRDARTNDIDLSINGVEYDLLMGNVASSMDAAKLDELLTKQGYKKQSKQTAIYDGKLFIVDHSGTWRQMQDDHSKVSDAVNAYLKVGASKKRENYSQSKEKQSDPLEYVPGIGRK